jgi:hypothetical protein
MQSFINEIAMQIGSFVLFLLSIPLALGIGWALINVIGGLLTGLSWVIEKIHPHR